MGQALEAGRRRRMRRTGWNAGDSRNTRRLRRIRQHPTSSRAGSISYPKWRGDDQIRWDTRVMAYSEVSRVIDET
jgi:hypothetical protein